MPASEAQKRAKAKYAKEKTFDYQSECHCSKTLRSPFRRLSMFDYQSECHCSKTGVAKQPRALHSKTLFKPASPKRYRYEASQEIIDSLISNELSGVRFSVHPTYTNRIGTPGLTKIVRDENGRKYVKSMQIGKQARSGNAELIDSLLHEELEARIALNRHSSEKYWELNSCSNEERHSYIQKIINKFMSMKGLKE